MEIKVERKYKLTGYTIGRLYVDGKRLCDTLEDVDRGLLQKMSAAEIQAIKVSGKTAIPRGTYNVQMGVVSPKFKDRYWATRWGGKLPRLQDVPGFEGILVHVGSSPEDTSGCLLVGENKQKGRLLNSQLMFDCLMEQLVAAWYRDEKITITFE